MPARIHAASGSSTPNLFVCRSQPLIKSKPIAIFLGYWTQFSGWGSDNGALIILLRRQPEPLLPQCVRANMQKFALGRVKRCQGRWAGYSSSR